MFLKHSKSHPGGKAQITWDNPKELEAYIQKLQAAAERLSTENRKLRKWHTNFIQKVNFPDEIEIEYLNHSFIYMMMSMFIIP